MLFRRFRLIVFALLSLLPLGLAGAQQQPQVAIEQLLNIAISAANQAIPGLGRPISYTYQYLPLVSDTALACPGAAGQPLPNGIQVSPVVFKLTFSKETYTIHVSSDGQFVRLCDTKFPTPTPGPTNTPVTPGAPTPLPATPTLNFLASCPRDYEGYLRPRIVLGPVTAQVAVGGDPNRLRTDPTLNSGIIGNAQPGRRFDLVLQGPVCNEGIVWWKVTIDNVTGWTAESDAATNTYFIEPVGGVSAPQPTAVIQPTPGPAGAPAGFTRAPGQVITPANVTGLTQLAKLPQERGFKLAWSPDGSKLGLILQDGGVFVYTYPSLQALAITLAPLGDAGRPTALAFSADGKYLAVGTDAGRLFAVQPVPGQIRVAELKNAHKSWVSSLAFSAQGALLASVSGRNDSTKDWTLKLWDIATLDSQGNAAVKLNLAYPYPLTGTAFGSNDTLLAVTGETQSANPTAALWVYQTGGGQQVYAVALTPMQGFTFVKPHPVTKFGDFVVGSGSTAATISVASQSINVYYTTAQNFWVSNVVARPGAGDPLVAVSNAQAGASSGEESVTFFNPEDMSKQVGILEKTTALDLAFSPDGKVLALATLDGPVELLGVP